MELRQDFATRGGGAQVKGIMQDIIGMVWVGMSHFLGGGTWVGEGSCGGSRGSWTEGVRFGERMRVCVCILEH